jgi:hypothetical protein
MKEGERERERNKEAGENGVMWSVPIFASRVQKKDRNF